MSKNDLSKKNQVLTITNENFSLSEKQKQTKAEELQSPDESHFANTPTSQSSSSPANGLTNQECSELLLQELEKLEEKDRVDDTSSVIGLTDTTPTLDALMSPIDENVSMFCIKPVDGGGDQLEIGDEEKQENNGEVS